MESASLPTEMSAKVRLLTSGSPQTLRKQDPHWELLFFFFLVNGWVGFRHKDETCSNTKYNVSFVGPNSNSIQGQKLKIKREYNQGKLKRMPPYKLVVNQLKCKEGYVFRIKGFLMGKGKERIDIKLIFGNRYHHQRLI